MRIEIGLLACVLGSAISGCAAEVVTTARPAVVVEEADPGVAPVVFAQPPALVEIEPGISVVENGPAAVYWIDGVYWEPRGNVWYRTSYWDEPWVSADVGVVPGVIVHRDPARYAHYHASADARVWHEPGEHPKPGEPGRRDERTEAHVHAGARNHLDASHRHVASNHVSEQPKKPLPAQRKKPRR